MVNLKHVKASNKGLKNAASGLTAVFIGATSGIGMGAVKKFAQDTISPVVYLAGRSKSSASPLLAELMSLNPEGNFIFIEAEVSLLKEVDKVCDEIKSKEQKIDLLFLSAGMLRTGRRKENTTTEGLAIMMALSYYCRMRFISNLLPLLSKSASPRVVTILAAGRETKINTDDLELSSESTYSMVNALNHTGTMTSLALSELAKANPRVSFIHKYPGVVNTGLFDGILSAWIGVWAILGTALRYTILPIWVQFLTSIDEAGERALYDATSEKFKGAGSYRLDQNDEPLKEVPVLSQYLKEGMGKKVWENTVGVFERVLSRAYSRWHNMRNSLRAAFFPIVPHQKLYRVLCNLYTNASNTSIGFRMGRKLPEQDVNIITMYLNADRTVSEIVAATKVHKTTIYRMRLNLDLWGVPYPPPTAKLGAPKLLVYEQELRLLAYLEDRPTAYLDEMQLFLFDEYSIWASIRTIYRTLLRHNWSRKVTSRKAAERSEELRRHWIGIQPGWRAKQLIFVDESAANERTGDRKYGWSLRGLEATDILPIKRSERWSILPVLTVDGYLDGTLIYQGSITSDIFESWIKNTVLLQCGNHGGDRSVLIIDNVSIYKSKTLKQICIAANVDLVFLLPYSPDFNPIEATFGDLKAWIKRNYLLAIDFEEFSNFLTFAIEQTRGRHASQHFKKAGYIVDI